MEKISFGKLEGKPLIEKMMTEISKAKKSLLKKCVMERKSNVENVRKVLLLLLVIEK